MARSVVLKGSVRCARCQHLPRWCICEGLREIECPLTVDVLVHQSEAWKPSSTGHLINRTLKGSGRHVFRPESPLAADDLIRPGKELWVLHPTGDPLPRDVAATTPQILLIDGNWTQAASMLRAVEGRGRRVRLPMSGASRYWLRAQQGEGRFSTAEALMFLLEAFELEKEHAALRLQFELHVYAGLLTRGRKERAQAFLAESPLREAMPELVAKLSRSTREERDERDGGSDEGDERGVAPEGFR